jgi:PIN domain nuclease of toxin-antitoxin system
MSPTSPVLDASALLAYLQDEPGAELVADAIAMGACMSTVNVAEALSRLADRGTDPDELAGALIGRGLLGGAIGIEPFTMADAIDVARLRPPTRTAGLSLGDRACLALALRLGARTLTADTAWSTIDVGVQLTQISEQRET